MMRGDALVGLGARVRLAIGLGESFGGDVGVDLSTPEARMTQHLLDYSEVRATVKQVSRRRVTKSVRPPGSASGFVGKFS